jgi:hypothetical protein
VHAEDAADERDMLLLVLSHRASERGELTAERTGSNGLPVERLLNVLELEQQIEDASVLRRGRARQRDPRQPEDRDAPHRDGTAGCERARKEAPPRLARGTFRGIWSSRRSVVIAQRDRPGHDGLAKDDTPPVAVQDRIVRSAPHKSA